MKTRSLIKFYSFHARNVFHRRPLIQKRLQQCRITEKIADIEFYKGHRVVLRM